MLANHFKQNGFFFSLLRLYPSVFLPNSCDIETVVLCSYYHIFVVVVVVLTNLYTRFDLQKCAVPFDVY